MADGRCPYPVFVVGVSLRLRGRKAVFLGLASGRYWATGADHTRWHSDARLPFLHVGVTRFLPDRPQRVRLTFMGWRGADHRPSPQLREWCWPSASARSSEPS